MTKKLSLFKSWLLLLVLMVGSSAAWADEVYYTLDGTITGGTNGYATESEITQNSMTWMVTGNTTMNPWRIGGKSLTNENRPVYSTTAMGSAISQVDLTVGTANLTVNSIKLIVASDAAFSNQIDEVSASYSASSTITFEPTTGTEWATGAYYKFVFNVTTSGSSNQYVQFSKAEFYYKPAASTATLESITLSGNYPTTFTEGATFSHEGMTVTATYDDNTTKDVTSKATFSAPDMSTIGTQEVTVSYSEGEVTKTATYNITVNAIPTHTVTWSVNGTTTSDTFKEGAVITFPANPTDIEGKTFVGWATDAITGITNTAPAFVTSATMGTADITYYAVFATMTAGTATTTDDELTADLIGASDKGYNDWSGKTFVSDAVYAGNSMTSTRNTVQIRTTNDNSGIVTTTSGGKVTKVILDWDSETNDARNVEIYGKKKAYSAATDLYSTTNSTKGTLLGTLPKGTTELNISDDYEFIGIRSKDGALYLNKITVTWTNGTPNTYSAYCTTVAADNRQEAELSFAEATKSCNLSAGTTSQALGNPNNLSPITWTSTNEAVATVNNDGLVTLLTAGETTIKASFAGNDDYKAGMASYVLTVVDPAVATTVSIDATGITNTNVFDGTAAGTLTATVKAGDTVISEALVTWSSSAPAVATIDENTGAVTLVAAGTTTITASYAGVADQYKPSTDTYELTVTNSDPNAPGTENNPYTVAQARAAIDAGTGVNGVYATGTVSKIVTAYNSQYGNISYNISADGSEEADQLQAYRGFSYNGDWFTSEDDIKVGDVVVVYGNLTKYGDTYEFAANNQLVSLTRPSVTTPSITVAKNSVNVDAAGANGTIDVTYNNITNVSAEVKFFEADGTTAATYNWITANIDSENKVEYTVEANTGDARTAYMKVYESNEDVYSELITVTQAKYVAPDVNVDPAQAGVGCFVKVTDDADLTAGNYLIVYEGDDTHASVAFDGSLNDLDVAINTIEVAIANDKIFASEKAVAAAFVIKPNSGTIQSASGLYIGQTSDANGLKASAQTAYTNTLSINEGVADILASEGAYLRYNATSGQERFRYYKSSSYTGQKAIQLYKYDATATAEPVNIEIKAGYKTFCYADALDFSGEDGITVYTATVDNNDVVTFNVVTSKKVPAGEGVLLQGANNKYNIPVIAAADAFNENAFVGVNKDTKVDAGIFVLMNGASGVGFYKATNDEGFTVSAHTAYLPALPNSARDFIGFGDDATTGIGNVNVNLNDNNVYNLQGQRVNKAQKGLYIVNGKKVVLK